VKSLAELIRRCGHLPIIIRKDVAGFVENRVLYAVMRECLDLVEQGVIEPQDLDACVSWGIGYKLAVVGPMALLDMAGLDIYAAVAGYLNKELSTRRTSPPTSPSAPRSASSASRPAAASTATRRGNPGAAERARAQIGRRAQGACRHEARRSRCACAAWRLAAWSLGASASAAGAHALAIMMPEEPTDYGWNQQGFEAAKAVAAKYHLKFMPATGLGYGDVRAQLRELADDGASLIIAHGAGYNTAAPEIGAELHVPVAIVDRPKDSKPGAVADYTLSGHQGAYLAGVLAAKTTADQGRRHRRDTGEPPSWNSQSAAFAQGVRRPIRALGSSMR
jgi:hypothetical protein